jgi:DNA polymerase III delta subunit
VTQALAAEGRAIDPRTAQLLVSRAGGDISKLRGDVERLALFTEGRASVGRADVEELTRADQAQDDWAVVNAVGDGDAARALREVATRFDRGDSPHALVGQLRRWAATRLPGIAPDRVRPALDALLRTDLALKSSGGDERVLLERLLIELSARSAPKAGAGVRRLSPFGAAGAIG